MFSLKKEVLKLQGGVRKRGKIWYYYFEAGTVDGVRRKIEKPAGSSKPEAESALREAIQKFEHGYVEPKKETVGQYIDEWIEGYIKENRKINTYNRYKEILKNSLTPNIGHILLKNIKPIAIENMLLTEKKKGLSSSTCQGIYGVVNAAFNRAVKLQIMPDNPCKYVERPKRSRFTANVLTVEEFYYILSTLDIKKYNDYIFSLALQVILELGLRRGELAGLEWKNIDTQNNTITILNNLIYSDSTVLMETTKTDESERTLYISDELIALLEAHHKRQKLNRVLYGENYIKNKFNNNEYDFIMTWESGKYIHPNYYTSKLAKVLKNAEFEKKIRFHDLRHTNATLLLEQGVDFKVLQKRLGHANISTTMDIYSHVNLKMQKNATEKLRELFDGGKSVAKNK
jgi:integrase